MIDLCHDAEDEEECAAQPFTALAASHCMPDLGSGEAGLNTPMQEPVAQAALAKVSIFHLHL